MPDPAPLPPTDLSQWERIFQHSGDLILVADEAGILHHVGGPLRPPAGKSESPAPWGHLTDAYVATEHRFITTTVIPTAITDGRWSGNLTLARAEDPAGLAVHCQAFRIDAPAPGGPSYLVAVNQELRGHRAGVWENSPSPMEEAQRRMASVLAATEVGTWTYEILENHVVADANLSRIFGLTPEEAAGCKLEVYLAAIHPEDTDRVQEAIAQSIKTGSTFTSEYRIIHKDGGIRWVIARGTVEYGADGTPLRLPGVILDITERVRIERDKEEISAEFARQSRTMDTLLSAMTDCAYVFDRVGRFVYVNRALLELWGLPVHDALGKTFAQLGYPDELATKLHGQVMQVIATNQRITDSTDYVGASGVTGHYEYILNPVTAPDGTVELVAGTTRDITATQSVLIALQQSEESFRTLAETLPDKVWTADNEGTILWLNSTLPETTGIPTEELLSRGFELLIHPDDRPATDCAWERARAHREVLDLQHRMHHADGTWRWHRLRSMPSVNADGSVHRWISVWSDIHDQRELHEKLEQSEAAFRQVANTMPQIVWAARADGVLDYYNDRWFEYIDQPPSAGDEASWQHYLHPDDLAPTHASWSQAVATGQPYSVEFRVRRADGEHRWFLVRALPMRDEQGVITRWFGTCTDVHDQRQLLAQLERSEALFRQLADSIPQLAWMARADGHLFWYNRRWHEYTGTTFDQVEGEGWTKVHDPEMLDQVKVRWKKSLESGNPFDMTFPLRGADGIFRPFLTRVEPLRDAEGRIELWFGTNTDVSREQRMMQEREELLASERAARSSAERNSRMKDEFLATLSHELRSPLNAIYGWTQLLRQGASDADTLAEGLDVIDRNVRLQTQLIEDLLDMSRIISGKLRMDVQPVDLADCIRAALATVQTASDAKGIRIESILDPLTGPISGDPGRMQQILWNLLSNAIKFTQRGGKVQVLLERVNSHVEISVIDSGEGISPDFLPHVFDRFRQADAALNRRHGGLGLGLAIVKQLVELHGGSIRVKSPGLGHGSTFIVALPLKAVHPPEHPEGRVQPHAPTQAPAYEKSCILTGLKVLVVDDERDARELVKRVLADCGAVVTLAASAPEALAQIKQSPPDVLVSDIGMPDVDGYEFIRQVRALEPEAGGRIPAIALTAFARSEDRTRSLLAGFLTHVSKPVEPAELVATIAAVSGRNRTL